MQISVRGLVVLGLVGAAGAAIVIAAAPLLAGAEADIQTSSKLTHESLGAMLQGMGLKPKLEQQRYDFQFKSAQEGEEWVFTMSAVLSRDGETVWVMAWLDELPKSAGEVPRTALLRLLADNDLMGNGKFFAYVAGNRRFVLQRVVPNQSISVDHLRAVLLDVGESVASTYGHWAVAGWNQPAATSTAQSAGGAKSPASQTTKAPIRNAAAPTPGSASRN